jgi:tetratricopeptide (TPR) repeat protein
MDRYRLALKAIPFLLLLCALLHALPLASSSSGQQSTPDNPEVASLLKEGNEALAAKKFPDAAKAFKKANKLDHDVCYACWIGLAYALDGSGDYSGARDSASKAISVSQTDAQRAGAHVVLGDILTLESHVQTTYDEKLLNQALSEYQTALQLNPEATEVHVHLGIALAKLSRNADAKAEFDKYLQANPTGKYAQTAKSYDTNPRLARDQLAPDFTVVTLQGQTIKLSEMTGRYVVLDFWATWCPPCRASVGEIKEMTHKYPPDRVLVISVSADDDDAKWKSFVAEKKMDWQQYRDAGTKLRSLYAIHAFPTYILIDPDGFIRERITGENPQQSIAYRLKASLATALGR